MDSVKAVIIFTSPDTFTNCLEFAQEFSLDVTDELFDILHPMIFIYDTVHALILFGFISTQHWESECVMHIF